MRARRLSVRALWGLASWALPLALIFFITPLLVHELGPPRFGILMTVFVAPLLASQLDFGITASSLRRLASMMVTGKVDAGTTLATFAIALGALGIALGSAVWLLAEPIARLLGFQQVLGGEEGSSLVRWCALWLATALLTLIPGVLARAAQAMIWITAVQTLNTAILWCSALLVAKTGRPLTEIVTVGVIANLISAAWTAFAMRRHVQWRSRFRPDPTLLLREARFSTGTFISQAAAAIVYQGDRVLVSAVGSPAIAGAYALCANLANKVLAAVVALTSFAFPHAAGLNARGDPAQLASFLHALDRSVVVVITPVLLPGVALAGPFLALWLGQYATPELATVFRMLWIGFALNAFSVPVASILAARGNTGLAARFAWLTATVVVCSILLLVPVMGATGAALAMMLGMATSPLFIVVGRRALELPAAPNRRRFWSGVAVGLVAQLLLLAAWQEHVSSWPLLLLAGASVVGMFYIARAIFGLLSPEERRLLQALTLRP